MNTIPAKKFISLGNERYLATEFNLSLRIIEIVHLAAHARKRLTFFLFVWEHIRSSLSILGYLAQN